MSIRYIFRMSILPCPAKTRVLGHTWYVPNGYTESDYTICKQCMNKCGHDIKTFYTFQRSNVKCNCDCYCTKCNKETTFYHRGFGITLIDKETEQEFKKLNSVMCIDMKTCTNYKIFIKQIGIHNDEDFFAVEKAMVGEKEVEIDSKLHYLDGCIIDSFESGIKKTPFMFISLTEKEKMEGREDNKNNIIRLKIQKYKRVPYQPIHFHHEGSFGKRRIIELPRIHNCNDESNKKIEQFDVIKVPDTFIKVDEEPIIFNIQIVCSQPDIEKYLRNQQHWTRKQVEDMKRRITERDELLVKRGQLQSKVDITRQALEKCIAELSTVEQQLTTYNDIVINPNDLLIDFS
jgi:hypothetical protein